MKGKTIQIAQYQTKENDIVMMIILVDDTNFPSLPNFSFFYKSPKNKDNNNKSL